MFPQLQGLRRPPTDAERRVLEDLRRTTLRTERWTEVLDHVERMPAFSADRYAPGPDVLRELGDRVGLFHPSEEGHSRVEVRRAENPAPRSSFGFVGCFVELGGKSDVGPGTLLVRFDSARLGSVPRETLRLFHWDTAAGAFRCLPVSGVISDADVAWGRVTQSGLYAVIGINADPFVVRTISAFASHAELMERLAPADAAQLKLKICGLVLCGPPEGRSVGAAGYRELIEEQVAAGWPSPPPGWDPPPGGGGGGLCDQCLGFEYPQWELVPEVQILNHPGLQPVCIGTPWQCPHRPPPRTWESIGPTNVGGYTLDIALDPSGNALYAATLNGGVWKLTWQNFVSPFTSLKFSWKPLTDPMDLLGLRVNAIAVAPAPLGDVYMIDGHTRLHQSQDGGLTWHLASQATFGTPHPQFPNPRLTNIHRMVVDPSQPTRVLIASSLGLFEHRPGQLPVTLHTGVVTDIAFDPGDPSRPYIAVLGVGVLRWNSTTSGWDTLLSMATAAALAATAFNNPVITIALGGQRTAQDRTIAAKFSMRPAAGGGNVVDVFVNRTSGIGTWTHCRPNPVLAEGLRVNGLAIDPFADDTMLVGSEGIGRTADGGLTWAGAGGWAHGDQHRIIFDPARNGVVYTSTDGGVYISVDHGLTWQTINKGFVGGQIFYLGMSGARIAGTFDDWGIIATDAVANTEWQWIDGGWAEAIPVRGDAQARARFYYLHGQISRRDVPPVSTPFRYAPFAATLGFAMDATAGSEVVLAADQSGQLHRTTNGDVATPNWQAEAGIALGAGEQIAGVAIIPGGATRRAFAISTSGKVFSHQDVGPGRASPSAWQLVGTWTSRTSSVLGLTVDSGGLIPHLYAWTEREAAVARTGGSVWTSIAGSGAAALPSGGIRAIVPISRGLILVAAVRSAGVFWSIDGGQRWGPAAAGLPRAIVTSLVRAGSDLYAATFGRGLWRLALP